MVKRENAGYGGYTDQAVDIRVDDHQEPIREIGRLLELALVNDSWNRGWTAFTEKRFPDALLWMERTAERAERTQTMLPEVLYDLAVVRLANDDRDGAKAVLDRAVQLNPRLAAQAAGDKDLAGLEP